MKWLFDLQTASPIAHAVLVLAAVAILGLALGSIKVRNIGLGISGVLFAGIFFAHFKMSINPDILNFVREFGLILFVYTIGMQVGPGFLTSLRRQGLPLNLMAAAIVLLGALVAVGIAVLAKVDMATVMAKSAHPGKDNTHGYFGFAGHSDPVGFRNLSVKVIDAK